MSGFTGLSFVVLALVYFLPTVVAVVRHSRVAPVLVVNLLLGWTVLGWIAALVVAVWPARKVEYVVVPYDGSTYGDDGVHMMIDEPGRVEKVRR